VKAHWRHVAEYAEAGDRYREVSQFVTVSSPFYTNLSTHYEYDLQDWLAAYADGDDSDTEDDGLGTE
jgi:hypothetical protein